MDMKNTLKMWMNSLAFLDNHMIVSIIVVILVLYSSCIFDNINHFIGNIYNFSIIRIIILLLIVYVTPKSPLIGILLAISFVISIKYMMNNENFSSKNENIPSGYMDMEPDDAAQVKESFFPLVDENESEPTMKPEVKNNMPVNSCMQNYDPKYETVGDVCSPTATFQGELNAQGLNYPEGFDHIVSGSPV